MKINHISPMKCIMCGFSACYEELPICRKCALDFQRILTARCTKCNRSATVCECKDHARALLFFNRPEAKKLLYTVKTNADKRTLYFLAELMIRANGINPQNYQAVTFVPRSAKNRRRYGYDQSKELATAISDIFGIPLISPLKRLKGQPQKLLSHAQRLKNIKNLYTIDNIPEETPKNLLLIDDIYTTGATLSVCSDILRRELGCKVTSLVLAKTCLK